MQISKSQREKMTAGRKKANEENKLLFECKDYIIEKIKLNYRIIIKCAKRNQQQGIERNWYSSDEFGIDEAHKMADYAIAEFFRKGVKPVNSFNLLVC